MAAVWRVKVRCPGWVTINAQLNDGPASPYPGTYTIRYDGIISSGQTTWLEDVPGGLLNFDVQLLTDNGGLVSGMNVGMHVHVPNVAGHTSGDLNYATSLGGLQTCEVTVDDMAGP